MPTYDYHCKFCKAMEERVVGLKELDRPQYCRVCGDPVQRVITRAPVSRFAGRASKGGGQDRFVADMLGIPLKELPSGLKTPEPQG